MGEKEIRPAGGDVVVPPAQATPPPRTQEKAGSGSPTEGPDPNAPVAKEDFEKQVRDAEAARKAGGTEQLYKDGWSEGHDASGTRYALDPEGVRGDWNPATKQYVDPASGKPFPKNWGAGHTP